MSDPTAGRSGMMGMAGSVAAAYGSALTYTLADRSRWGFGGQGDVDDTAAVQLAIDAAHQDGPLATNPRAGIVELPAGAIAAVDRVVMRSGVRLVGKGERSSTVQARVYDPGRTYGLIEFDDGPVLHTGLEKICLLLAAQQGGAPRNPNQRALYHKAKRVGGQGGVWYSSFRDVFVYSAAYALDWTGGPTPYANNPEQFNCWDNFNVSLLSTVGFAVRFAGQTGQNHFRGCLLEHAVGYQGPDLIRIEQRAWASGDAYVVHDVLRASNGTIYEVTALSSGTERTAGNEPSHGAGSATGADGITWTVTTAGYGPADIDMDGCTLQGTTATGQGIFCEYGDITFRSGYAENHARFATCGVNGTINLVQNKQLRNSASNGGAGWIYKESTGSTGELTGNHLLGTNDKLLVRDGNSYGTICHSNIDRSGLFNNLAAKIGGTLRTTPPDSSGIVYGYAWQQIAVNGGSNNLKWLYSQETGRPVAIVVSNSGPLVVEHGSGNILTLTGANVSLALGKRASLLPIGDGYWLLVA